MKELILIFATIVVTSFWNKYLEPMWPEKNKMISGMKKLLRFTARYVIPIFFLIYVFWKTDFDKYFIFNVVFMSCVIIYRIINDFILKLKLNIYNILVERIGIEQEKKMLEFKLGFYENQIEFLNNIDKKITKKN